MPSLGEKILNSFSLENIGNNTERALGGIGRAGGFIASGFGNIGNKIGGLFGGQPQIPPHSPSVNWESSGGEFPPNPQPQVVSAGGEYPPPTGKIPTLNQPPKQAPDQTLDLIPKISVGQTYQNHLQKVKDAEAGSFKKGGAVKKTGNYKLHKGEYVLNPRLVALIKSGEGPKLKGYDKTYKTVPKKSYDFNKSVRSYQRTGFFKTREEGQGHDAGYLWAKKKKVDPLERKRKYGRNSPSFDEAVKAYKLDKREVLKNKMK